MKNRAHLGRTHLCWRPRKQNEGECQARLLAGCLAVKRSCARWTASRTRENHAGQAGERLRISRARRKQVRSACTLELGLRYPSSMDVLRMLAELREERTQIEEAIIVIERLAQGRGRRRGRPPAWLAAAGAPKRRGRPPGSKNKPKNQTAA